MLYRRFFHNVSLWEKAILCSSGVIKWFGHYESLPKPQKGLALPGLASNMLKLDRHTLLCVEELLKIKMADVHRLVK